MNILLAVSGGIAAYKSLELTSLCRKAGHTVRIVLTEHAACFVTPLSFETLSGQPVITGMFDGSAETVDHINLAKWADIVIVAPATANCIAKFAHGLADDFLSTLIMAYGGTVYLAPAMNVQMYDNPVLQRNLKDLQNLGFKILEPAAGYLACGDTGKGRMMEAKDIFTALSCDSEGPLKGRHILVSAGPTRESLDPVRFITNHSSGKMGYAIATIAREMGAEVTLVSGPTHLEAPRGVRLLSVESTQEMFDAITRVFPDTDAVIMAAAPSDYRPAEYRPQKIKKGEEDLVLRFKKNPDILAHLGQIKTHQILVGFAAESDHTIENARGKCVRKSCDFVVANNITEADAGFGHDVNTVHIVGRDNVQEALPTMTKRDLAEHILKQVVSLMNDKENATL